MGWLLKYNKNINIADNHSTFITTHDSYTVNNVLYTVTSQSLQDKEVATINVR